MRIALVKLPATYADWYKRPVLGLSYLAAVAERAGHDCRILDAYFNDWSETQLIERVLAYRPEVIGFTAMTHEVKVAGRIAARLKESSRAVTVIGGCHVTALPERTLAEFPALDFAVCGEGERTFLELLSHIGSGRTEEPGDIRGLVYRTVRGIRMNGPQPSLSPAELDLLPLPAFHHYYGEDARALAGRGSEYVMLSGRGCPFGCAFCMRVLGQKVRRRSAEGVVREMDYAATHYGAHTFDFEDDVMLVDSEATRVLLQLMVDSGLSRRVRWSGMIHAAFVRPELVALAKKAGCYRIWMGVESGDDSILKTINKGITVDQVRRAVKTIKQAKVGTGTFFILGHPGETEETAHKTMNLMAELNTDAVAVGLMVPYPGTAIYEMAAHGENGYRLLSDDWSEYDKYGGRALELDGMPWEKLAGMQRSALLNFYVENLRLYDLARYAWHRRRAFRLLLHRQPAA
jgi:anaerobic magnesium-protoporphyrin IX monomethyl ester cyclase